FFMAGILKQISRHSHQEGSISSLTLYGAWWLAGAMLVLATFMLRRPADRDAQSPMSRLPARLYIFVPFISVLVHLAGANRVYWIHFEPVNVAPLLLGVAVLFTRWRGVLGGTFIGASQCALAGLAVLISLPFPPELMIHAGSHAI